MEKKLDLSKPVQTRDGRKVRIHATDRKCSEFPIVGLVDNGTDAEEVLTWTREGKYYNPNASPSDLDLVNVPKKHVGYVNVYVGNVVRVVHGSRMEADKNLSPFSKRIACVRLEYEEGQFDE